MPTRTRANAKAAEIRLARAKKRLPQHVLEAQARDRMKAALERGEAEKSQTK